MISLQSFSYELTKLAEEYVPVPEDNQSALESAAGGGLGFIAPATLNIAARVPTYSIVSSSTDPRRSSSEQQAAIRRMIKDMELNNRAITMRQVNSHPLDAYALPHIWSNKEDHIQIPHGAGDSVAAHELGHISNYRQLERMGALGRGLSNVSNASRTWRMPAAALAGAVSGAQEDDSYNPAHASALVSAPTLIDEGLASLKATKQLVKMHGLGGGLKRAIPLAAAFGAYASLPAAPYLVTKAKRMMKEHNKEEKSKEKSSSVHGAIKMSSLVKYTKRGR